MGWVLTGNVKIFALQRQELQEDILSKRGKDVEETEIVD